MTQNLDFYTQDPLLAYICIIGLATVIQKTGRKYGPSVACLSTLIEKIHTVMFHLQLSLPANSVTVLLKRKIVDSTWDASTQLMILWGTWTAVLAITWKITQPAPRPCFVTP